MTPAGRLTAFIAAAASVFFVGAPAARAEHAVIKLEVIAPDGRQESAADHEPPLGGTNPRKRIIVKAGDPLVLQFVLTDANPHKRINDVVVRYFVSRIASSAVKAPADPKQGVVTEGTVKMNFKPDCRVGARLKFRIDAPGIYIARVETHNTDSDHEHFSAIEVEAK